MKAIRQLVREEEGAVDSVLLTESAAPRFRALGRWNLRGLWALTVKETWRFLKIWTQTLVSPLVMTLLFYAVFALSLKAGPGAVGGVPFLQFLLPGLVMMAMAQAAYMNNSASIILSKIQGNMVDLLMAPLSPMELTLGYAIAGALRGILVGGVTLAVLAFFLPVHVHSLPFVFYHAVMGSLMLSLMGLITGVWGRDFDHLVAVQNFLIMPATFLSGTFFSASSLPGRWSLLCALNPFYYMIDGFRYGFTGHTDGNLFGGLAFLLFMNLVLFNIAYWMFSSGTRLKN